jgi:signal transduction histidine kinase
LLQWESGAKETLQGLKAQLDIAKFAQVLRNILSNALKFTPVGGNVTLSTELISNSVKSSSSDVTETETEESMGQFMRFSVEDSGVGISEEDQKSLFSEFKQINPAKLQNGGGSGLGLWGELIPSMHSDIRCIYFIY